MTRDRPAGFKVTHDEIDGLGRKQAEARQLRKPGWRSQVHALGCLQEHADRQQLAALEVAGHLVESLP
jgi:hypothetical protein